MELLLYFVVKQEKRGIRKQRTKLIIFLFFCCMKTKDVKYKKSEIMRCLMQQPMFSFCMNDREDRRSDPRLGTICHNYWIFIVH